MQMSERRLEENGAACRCDATRPRMRRPGWKRRPLYLSRGRARCIRRAFGAPTVDIAPLPACRYSDSKLSGAEPDELSWAEWGAHLKLVKCVPRWAVSRAFTFVVYDNAGAHAARTCRDSSGTALAATGAVRNGGAARQRRSPARVSTARRRAHPRCCCTSRFRTPLHRAAH